MYSCPKCGLENASVDGNQFCGKCEEAYRKEQAVDAQAEIDNLRKEMSQCPCEDGDCPHCCLKQARVFILQGEPEKAEYLMNM